MSSSVNSSNPTLSRWEEPTGRIKVSNMAADLFMVFTGANTFGASGTLTNPVGINLNGYTYTFLGNTGPILQIGQSGATGYVSITGKLNVSGGIDPTYLGLSETNQSNVISNVGGAIYVSDGTDSQTQGALIYKSQTGGLTNILSAQIPTGTNYGDYLIWNGNNYISQDTSVTLGGFAGAANNAEFTVAVGYGAGNNSQATQSVAVGPLAGATNQGANSIAVGPFAGNNSQGIQSVALGAYAGFVNQSQGSVAIGYQSGFVGQNSFSTAIGYNAAGNSILQTNSIALGAYAFYNGSQSNSICINASGNPVNGLVANSLYINPIRVVNDTGANYLLYYNTGSSEITANLISNVKYTSNIAATGIVTSNYTASNTGPIIIQNLNLSAPSHTGNYALNVSYGVSITNTGPASWIVSDVLDNSNSSYGASSQTYSSVTNGPNNLSLQGSGVLFSSGNFPYVYTASSTAPKLQLQVRVLSGTGSYTVNGFPNSGFDSFMDANYIPL